MKIKVCGMKYPDNVRELVLLKPDYMGFIFYPKSKRYIGEKIDPKVLEFVPSEIKKVGVFVNEPIQSLIEKHASNKLDFVQLHGGEGMDYCKKVKEANIQIIKAFSVDDSFDLQIVEKFKPFVSFVLFDTKCDNYGGSGKKFNWDKLSGYDNEIPVFLSGGIGHEDVQDIKGLEDIDIEALDINSKFEIEPGLKNIGLLKGFFEKIKDNEIYS